MRRRTKHPTSTGESDLTPDEADAANTRPSSVPPPPAARQRTPLRRMPTEQIKTTRMRAVLRSDGQSAQRSSGVVPCAPHEPESASHTTHETSRALLEVDPPRAAPRRTQPQWGAAIAFVQERTAMIGGDEYPLDQDTSPPIAEPSAMGPLDSTASFALEAVARAQHDRAIALKQALSSEQQARAAELRAVLAEQSLWMAQSLRQTGARHEPEPLETSARKGKLLRNTALAGLVGLAIGGYLSLFYPLRKHAPSQHDVNRELEALSQQLREENQELRLRLRQLKQAPSTDEHAQ